MVLANQCTHCEAPMNDARGSIAAGGGTVVALTVMALTQWPV